MVLDISDSLAQRLQACRLQFNSFTNSKLTFDQYLAEVLSDAVVREERISKISRGLSAVRGCHAH